MTWDHLNRYLAQHHITYPQYVASQHWQNRRGDYWRDNWEEAHCFTCGKAGKLEIHHTTYERIGAERNSDLCFLCHSCHTKLHKLELAGKCSLATAHFYLRGVLSRNQKTKNLLTNRVKKLEARLYAEKANRWRNRRVKT